MGLGGFRAALAEETALRARILCHCLGHYAERMR